MRTRICQYPDPITIVPLTELDRQHNELKQHEECAVDATLKRAYKKERMKVWAEIERRANA